MEVRLSNATSRAAYSQTRVESKQEEADTSPAHHSSRLCDEVFTVKRSITLAAEPCHVEVTTLLVPGENDSAEEIRMLAQWLASVDRDIPASVTVFPSVSYDDRQPTTLGRVYRLADEAGEYLSFVYTGNC